MSAAVAAAGAVVAGSSYRALAALDMFLALLLFKLLLIELLSLNSS